MRVDDLDSLAAIRVRSKSRHVQVEELGTSIEEF
jgi:C4-type Zn-finger protein